MDSEDETNARPCVIAHVGVLETNRNKLVRHIFVTTCSLVQKEAENSNRVRYRRHQRYRAMAEWV